MFKKIIAESRQLVYRNQLKWFEEYRTLVQQGKVLVVGHGLGYTTDIIIQHNQEVTAIDITLEKEALQKEKVTVYNGDAIPFEDNLFDAVVITYVLHHADSSEKLFNELVRVCKSKIIILEETYTNFFQKIDLVFYCWYFNRKAGQRVQIKWRSYLTTERLLFLAQKSDLQTILHKEEPMRSYKTELFIFSK